LLLLHLGSATDQRAQPYCTLVIFTTEVGQPFAGILAL
jgi:hypothetical protein